MALLGYARVSTLEQEPSLQLDALETAGCERTYTDHASGALADRPELAQAPDHLRRGDTLVVWRLDRLGRSLRHLVDTVGVLEERGVGFRSLTESIDTTTPGGRHVFHVFAALAESERDLIRERTHAGLAAARARGRRGGRRSVTRSSRWRGRCTTQVSTPCRPSPTFLVSAAPASTGISGDIPKQCDWSGTG